MKSFVKFRFQFFITLRVWLRLTGHHDCAANDADKEEHIEQILEGVRVLLSYGLNARVLGLWLNEWNSVELVWDTQEREPARSFL